MSFDFFYLTWLAYLDFLLSLEPGLLLAEGGRRPRRGTEVRKKKKKLISVVWDSTVGLLGFVWLLTFFIVRTIRSITFAWGNIRKFQHQRKFKLFLNLTFPWRCSFGLFGVVGRTNFYTVYTVHSYKNIIMYCVVKNSMAEGWVAVFLVALSRKKSFEFIPSCWLAMWSCSRAEIEKILKA